MSSVRQSIFAFCCVMAPLLHAQDPFRFGERVEVEVVDLEVVAVDRDNTPVTNLARNEFTVSVNDEPAEIVDFAAHFPGEVTTEIPATPTEGSAPAQAPAAAEPDRSRVWLVFIDLLRIGDFRRTTAIRGVREFLDASVRPGDRVMVAFFDGAALRVVQPLTDKRGAALKELQKLGGRAIPPRLNRIGFQMDEEDVFRTERAAIRALRDYVAIASGTRGRRLLLIVGGGYRLHGWENLDRGARLQREYEELRDALAASDITAHGVYAWAEGLRSFGADSAAELEASMDGPAPEVSPIAMGSTVSTLARDSGGLPFVAASDLQQRLERAERTAQGHYALAVRSPSRVAGERLDIRVGVSREGVRVRHRRLVRVATDLETTRHLNTAALLETHPQNPWNVHVVVGRVQREGPWSFRAPIEVRVPLDPILFAARGERHSGHLQFFVSVRDADGYYTSVDPKELKLDLSSAELAVLRKRGIRYRLELMVSRGVTDVSLTVADVLARSHSTARFEIVPGPR